MTGSETRSHTLSVPQHTLVQHTYCVRSNLNLCHAPTRMISGFFPSEADRITGVHENQALDHHPGCDPFGLGCDTGNGHEKAGSGGAAADSGGNRGQCSVVCAEDGGVLTGRAAGPASLWRKLSNYGLSGPAHFVGFSKSASAPQLPGSWSRTGSGYGR